MSYKFQLDKNVYSNKLQAIKNKDSIALQQYLVDLLNLKKADSVLDVGCGHGHTLKYILKKLGKSGRATGLDSNEKLLAVTERVNHPDIASGRLELNLADASKRFPFPNSSYSKIISHNVLECVPNKVAHLNECYRVLKQGGTLVMSHTDFDTALYHSSHEKLTRKLLHNYADATQGWQETSDGKMGRKLFGLFQKSKFSQFEVDCYTTINTEYAPQTYGYDYSNWVASMAKKNGFGKGNIKKWTRDLELLNKRKEYFFSINVYIIIAHK